MTSATSSIATSATAGTWRQIAVGVVPSGGSGNLGLARTRSGILHVLIATPNASAATGIADVPISPAGAPGTPRTVVSGWKSAQYPDAYVGADGAVHAFWSGSKTASTTDPTTGLDTATGPGNWKVTPSAIATGGDIQEEQVRVTEVKGAPVFVWPQGPSLYLGGGISPSVKPQVITVPGQIAYAPVIAPNASNGGAEIAWGALLAGGKTDGSYRSVAPVLGPPARLPGSQDQYPVIAARTGGGVYSAYSPDGTRVVLTKLGGPPRPVPVPAGAQIKAVGVFTGPAGRLWLAFGNRDTIWVTRTSKSLSRFEPLQTLAAPAGAFNLLRLEGEGSAGALDLFADVLVNGGTKDGSYFQHVRALLAAAAVARPVMGAKGKVKAYIVTVRVSDAGDPVAAASVSGFPGGPRRTGVAGNVVVTLRAVPRTLTFSVGASGYVGVDTSVTVLSGAPA
jgi:hypothetical protein